MYKNTYMYLTDSPVLHTCLNERVNSTIGDEIKLNWFLSDLVPVFLPLALPFIIHMP